ncbi:small membrane protein [Klebsiella sp. MISC125]|uniref:small membrane protein n=1 Tax=Klebsiella sp. MISC125 TaxID=2755386 RepID=UPI003DA7BC24
MCFFNSWCIMSNLFLLLVSILLLFVSVYNGMAYFNEIRRRRAVFRCFYTSGDRDSKT